MIWGSALAKAPFPGIMFGIVFPAKDLFLWGVWDYYFFCFFKQIRCLVWFGLFLFDSDMAVGRKVCQNPQSST